MTVAKLQGRKATVLQPPWLHEEQLRAKCNRGGGRLWNVFSSRKGWKFSWPLLNIGQTWAPAEWKRVTAYSLCFLPENCEMWDRDNLIHDLFGCKDCRGEMRILLCGNKKPPSLIVTIQIFMSEGRPYAEDQDFTDAYSVMVQRSTFLPCASCWRQVISPTISD